MKPGDVIGGKYRLLRQIGEGAMGVVWSAVNESTTREVALKLVLRSSDDRRHRLLREARACGKLSHRNIVEVYDVGQTQSGDPFLVMPLLSGETVAELLDRQRRMDPPLAAQIGRDAARALAAAHAASIIHREVHEVRPGAGVTTWEFEPETFAPIAKIEGKERYGIVTDHLGTPLAMFDEAGEIAWKAQLDVYGAAQIDVMRTPCPWRWPGQYEDEETGLRYNRFRYYDPTKGEYVSQDPIRTLGGHKLYRYTLNPISQMDPFGLIDPFDILFTQDSIDNVFQHGPWAGKPLTEAIEEAKRLGELPEGLNLHVMNLNDEWVTLDNRTLFVAQEAGLKQVHPEIVGEKGLNKLNKLLDGKAPLPRGEQPRIRGCH